MRGARTDIVNMGGDSLLHMASAHGKYDVIVKVHTSVYPRWGVQRSVLPTFLGNGIGNGTSLDVDMTLKFLLLSIKLWPV